MAKNIEHSLNSSNLKDTEKITLSLVVNTRYFDIRTINTFTEKQQKELNKYPNTDKKIICYSYKLHYNIPEDDINKMTLNEREQYVQILEGFFVILYQISHKVQHNKDINSDNLYQYTQQSTRDLACIYDKICDLLFSNYEEFLDQYTIDEDDNIILQIENHNIMMKDADNIPNIDELIDFISNNDDIKIEDLNYIRAKLQNNTNRELTEQEKNILWKKVKDNIFYFRLHSFFSICDYIEINDTLKSIFDESKFKFELNKNDNIESPEPVIPMQKIENILNYLLEKYNNIPVAEQTISIVKNSIFNTISLKCTYNLLDNDYDDNEEPEVNNMNKIMDSDSYENHIEALLLKLSNHTILGAVSDLLYDTNSKDIYKRFVSINSPDIIGNILQILNKKYNQSNFTNSAIFFNSHLQNKTILDFINYLEYRLVINAKDNKAILKIILDFINRLEYRLVINEEDDKAILNIDLMEDKLNEIMKLFYLINKIDNHIEENQNN